MMKPEPFLPCPFEIKSNWTVQIRLLILGWRYRLKKSTSLFVSVDLKLLKRSAWWLFCASRWACSRHPSRMSWSCMFLDRVNFGGLAALNETVLKVKTQKRCLWKWLFLATAGFISDGTLRIKLLAVRDVLPSTSERKSWEGRCESIVSLPYICFIPLIFFISCLNYASFRFFSISRWRLANMCG